MAYRVDDLKMKSRSFAYRSYWSKFLSHVKRVCKKSTLTGIPQIVAANNLYRKIIRIVVFLLCTFGFGFQFWEFMHLYWDYPTVMDVQVSSPSEIVLPAFTICDSNGYGMREYCQNEPSRCGSVANATEYCRVNRFHCISQILPEGLQIPTNETDTIYRLISADDVDLGPVANRGNKIKKCEILSNDKSIPCSEPVITPFMRGHIPTRTNCLTFNSVWKKPGVQPERISSSSRINLIWLPDLRNYIHYVPADDYMSYIAVHSPMAPVNPFLFGYAIRAGDKAKINIEEREIKLLPSPYHTDCEDYESKWRNNGNQGPTSQVDCIEICKKDLIVNLESCVDFFNWYPHEERVCDTGCTDFLCSSGFKGYDRISGKLKEFELQCAKKCKPACDQVIYHINPENVQIDEIEELTLWGYDARRFLSYMTISFENFVSTKYTYSPKFEYVEIFCYLGGYIGMWLGISLIALFDFVETLAVIFIHPWRRWNQKLKL